MFDSYDDDPIGSRAGFLFNDRLIRASEAATDAEADRHMAAANRYHAIMLRRAHLVRVRPLSVSERGVW